MKFDVILMAGPRPTRWLHDGVIAENAEAAAGTVLDAHAESNLDGAEVLVYPRDEAHRFDVEQATERTLRAS